MTNTTVIDVAGWRPLPGVRYPSDAGVFRHLRVLWAPPSWRFGSRCGKCRRCLPRASGSSSQALCCTASCAGKDSRNLREPSGAAWLSLRLLMFVAEYAPLFWAEKYVPSGIASVLEATLPLITMVLETLVFRRHRFHWRLLAAILLGFCGGRLCYSCTTANNSSACFPVWRFWPAPRPGHSGRCSPARWNCRNPEL